MGRLIRVELLRLWSRRLVKVCLAVLVGGVLLINTGDFLSKDATEAEGLRRAERIAAQAQQDCLNFGKEGLPPDAQPRDCSGEQFDAAGFKDERRYILRDDARDDVIGAGFMVALIAFLVGTSFAGAEWAAGTMAALLFWEPRRVRVLMAKVIALGGSVAVVSVVMTGVQLLLALGKASARGSTEGLPSGFWGDRFADGGRMAGIAVFATLLAFGIAGIARVTGAALGIAFAYFAILENVVRGFRPGWRRYLIGEQFQAWVDGRAELQLTNSFDALGQAANVFVLERARAGATLAIYLTIILGVMIALFARRDVT